MESANLPPFPQNLGFEIKNQSIEDLSVLWDCSRRTLTERIRRIRDLLGARLGTLYTADQVIIMCLIWEPPEKYYNFFKWMEVNGWKEYYAKKHKLEDWLDPDTRTKLFAERYVDKGKEKKKKKR